MVDRIEIGDFDTGVSEVNRLVKEIHGEEEGDSVTKPYSSHYNLYFTLGKGKDLFVQSHCLPPNTI